MRTILDANGLMVQIVGKGGGAVLFRGGGREGVT